MGIRVGIIGRAVFIIGFFAFTRSRSGGTENILRSSTMTGGIFWQKGVFWFTLIFMCMGDTGKFNFAYF